MNSLIIWIIVIVLIIGISWFVLIPLFHKTNDTMKMSLRDFNIKQMKRSIKDMNITKEELFDE